MCASRPWCRASQSEAGTTCRRRSLSDAALGYSDVHLGYRKNGGPGEVSRWFVAHGKVPALTRLLRVLAFSSSTQNARFYLREWRWKRVRLACAGLLAGCVA